MRTHSAFLRHLLGVADRAMVSPVPKGVQPALTWAVARDRGLGLPALRGRRELRPETDRTALTLLALRARLAITWGGER